MLIDKINNLDEYIAEVAKTNRANATLLQSAIILANGDRYYCEYSPSDTESESWLLYVPAPYDLSFIIVNGELIHHRPGRMAASKYLKYVKKHLRKRVV